MNDVLAACCRGGGTLKSLACVLLWQRSKCVSLHGAASAEFCGGSLLFVRYVCAVQWALVPFHQCMLVQACVQHHCSIHSSSFLLKRECVVRSARLNLTRVCTCRGAFSITAAFTTGKREKRMANYGADGTRAGTPSCDAHMLSAMGQRQLRAFEKRVQARLRKEVSAAPSLDQPGALQLISSLYVLKVSRTSYRVVCIANTRFELRHHMQRRQARSMLTTQSARWRLSSSTASAPSGAQPRR